jgi:hypothetical protein
MAAGLGFKTFTTGEVLTAADTNGYLMQGILVFADATARDAAITAPEEGQFAYLKDTNVTTYYTGSAWANVDTTGMTNPMTTTGDIIYSSSGSTPARLGIGTVGQILQVNSGATAPEWAAASSGGAVLQVKSAIYSTSTTNATATFTDTGLSVSITPTSASNKVLIIVSQSTRCNYTSAAYENAIKLRINRDSTAIYNDGGDMWYVNNTNQTAGGDYRFYQTMVYLDSPASTSALTYKTQQRTYTGAVTCQPFSVPSTITVMEVTP